VSQTAVGVAVKQAVGRRSRVTETQHTLRFLIVDDDPDLTALVLALLEAAGHEVRTAGTGSEALGALETFSPDCVLVDLMLPDMDGFDLCTRLRPQDAPHGPKLVVVSAKHYAYDRAKATRIGVDGYFVKPIDPNAFVSDVERIVRDEVAVGFWGVRGTLPVSGRQSLRYGGNTSCVSLEFPDGRRFIFDAGTGIKVLSDHLRGHLGERQRASLFISHPHWDHINALPFFVPFYVQGNEFDLYGPSAAESGFEALIFAQMDSVYFPITSREFAASVRCHTVSSGERSIEGVQVKTMLLSHPGTCLGYRVEYGGRAFCYITDNELFLPDNPYFNPHYEASLRSFVSGADLLVTDTTYSDAEYANRVGWGHSAVGPVVELAHQAEVQRLCLFHHDPDQDDDAIDAKLAAAQAQLSELGSGTECQAPAEGDRLWL
jgi:phosphoribosyl 1,2-cyclic phosphodiesterase/ActR/RegA family two-component response regulator